MSLLALAIGLAVAPHSAVAQQNPLPTRTAIPPPATAFGKLPLSFAANRGQAAKEMKFLSQGAGYSIALTDKEVVLSLSRPAGYAHSRNKNSEPRGEAMPAAIASRNLAPEKQRLQTDTVRMRLAGSSAHAVASGEDPLAGTVNYFTGADSANWRTGIETFGKVRYSGVYPGVDAVYYGNQRKLEYDFVVSAGADARPIRLQFSGAKTLKVDSEGNLTISAANGEVQFHRPEVYQQDGSGGRTPVAGSFRLLPKKTVGFRLGRYDHRRPLIIDPVLSYSTYLGAAGSGEAIAVDSEGNAYVTGYAFAYLPTTPGTVQAWEPAKGDQGSFNAFVTKFNSTGTAMIYSTYLGGNCVDIAYAIALDAQDNAYVAGSTCSNNFPATQGAFQTTNNTGSNDTGFVAKLNSTGTTLIYSTYLGGSVDNNPFKALGLIGEDSVSAIAVDAAGNAYLTGGTGSLDFPVTPGAFQSTNKITNPVNNTGFVTKLNTAGTGLIYSTYLGGSGLDELSGIVLNSAGNAYIVGSTESYDFPVTPGVFQTTNNSKGATTFLTEMNATGSGLVFSTYLGGSLGESAFGLSLDSSGAAYVTGFTLSTDFPLTAGAYQTKLGGRNAFVAKFNPTGAALEYSTLLGGTYDAMGGVGIDSGLQIVVDSGGNATVVGTTESLDFPTTPGAMLTQNLTQIYSLEEGSFLTRLNSTGTALLYSTFLGGQGDFTGYTCDCVVGAAIDATGDIYLTGITVSTDFPITNSFQSVPGNIFVTKFSADELKPLPATTMTLTASPNPQTPPMPVTVTAQVQPSSGGSTPTGSVAFSFNGGPWATAPVDGTGTATYPIINLPRGQNAIAAYYLGDANNAASIGSATETMNPTSGNLPVAITITPNMNPAAFNAPVTFNISVTDPSGKGIPSGYVELFANLQYLSQGSLDSKGNAVFTTTFLTPGVNDVGIGFWSSSNSYANNHADFTENVTPLGTAPAPVLSIQSGTYTGPQTLTITDAAPLASIFYTVDGSTPSEGGTSVSFYQPVAVTSSETVKAIAVVTGYTNSAVVSATYDIVQAPAPTPTFSPAAGTYTSAQQVSIADSLTGASIYYTTDGSIPSSNSLPYTRPITVNASETIQAVAAATNYAISAVATASYVINLPPPDFAMSLAPTSLTVSSGQSGTSTVTLTSQNGFNQAVSLSCSGLPSGGTCAFSPATATPTTGGATSTLTIQTASATTQERRNSLETGLGGICFAMLIPLAGSRKMRKMRKMPGKRRAFRIVVGIAPLVLLAGISACGGGANSTSPPPVQPQNYSVTVTAAQGSTSHSATLTLVVE